VLALHGFLGGPEDWDAVKKGLRVDLITPGLPGHEASLPSNSQLGLPSNGQLTPPPNSQPTPPPNSQPTPPSGHPSEEGMGLMGWNGSNHLDSTSPYQLPHPLLGGVPGGRGGLAVIGYSMGGRIALQMALAYPNQVKKLILISSSPGIADPIERQARYEADCRLADKLEKIPLADFLEDWYNQPLFASLKAHPGFLSMLERRQNHNPKHLAEALRQLSVGNQPSLWDKLEKLSCPTLLLTGELDSKYHHIAKHMAELSSMITWKQIDGAGHALLTEAPEAVAAEISHFLKSAS
jgi:2-succinyl-6-hydroxy-2,4-cyclohexadiene-1-carboxylate synthase